ncbi:AmmeMemoRadiSam system protein B [Candidatus Nomurabacteria bacterium]|nr:AmmeMemoRadiSam system protein B [Candidatus Nomurabacteria bacterium]
MNRSFYDEAYTAGTSSIKIANEKIYGGIIPHHLIVKDKVAAWFMGLAKKDYQTVILIGPNHYQTGTNNIIISQNKWQTPYGELLPDLELGKQLAQNKEISIEEGPFLNEHSISGLVPFIKNSLTEAKILPIILKTNTPKKDLDLLVDYLKNNTDPEKTLILASVDFSHYQPLSVADFHDQLSQSVIEDFDLERVNKLEIDSPASIYTILSYLEKIEAKKSDLVFHTNSSDLLDTPEEAGTSHLFYYFSKGENLQKNGMNLLFFGDLMLDRDVKNKLENNGLGYVFDDLAGGENRFFMGNDLVSANLESALTNNGDHYPPELTIDFAADPKYLSELKNKYFFNFFNLANNHLGDQGARGLEETTQNLKKLDLDFSGCTDRAVDQCSLTTINIADKKVALLGFSMVYGQFDLEQALKKIEKAKNEHDLVIVQIHWGTEYQHQINNLQKNLAHQVIDAGADILIGHHPHVVQGLEIYNNKPIFYSLGNFVFDQYFSQDTQQELSIGIHLREGQLEIYLFPISSEKVQLSLMKSDEKKIFLENLISWSNLDSEISEQVRAGKILLTTK